MQDEITHVGIVGSGAIGAGLAGLALSSGLTVTVVVRTRNRIAAVGEQVARALERRARRTADPATYIDEALAGLDVTTDYEALAGCRLGFEAVVEDRDSKVTVLNAMARFQPDQKIIATCTSSIPIGALATGVPDRERLIGVHFFNPVPAMRLVEIIPSLNTAKDVIAEVENFVVDKLGKEAVHAPDRAGFIVNSLLVPYLLAAVRAVERGEGTARTIDTAMKLGCGYPMGPIELIDLIGLDVVAAVSDALYEETGELAYRRPVLLRRMVDAGRLGAKSGLGFYDHTAE